MSKDEPSPVYFIEVMRTWLRNIGSKLVNTLGLQPLSPKLASQEDANHLYVDLENRITNLEDENAKMFPAFLRNGRSVEGIVVDNATGFSENAILKRRINKTSETVSKLLGKNKELRTMICSLRVELNSFIDLAQKNQARVGVLEGDVARFRSAIGENSASTWKTENDDNDRRRRPTTSEDVKTAKQVETTVTAFEGMIIHNRWKLGKKLGLGSGGLVCEALDMFYQENRAAKLEVNESAECSSLLREYRVYEILHRQNGLSGFSRVHFFGTCGPFNVLILDLLGPSLIEFCPHTLTMDSVFGVGVQCLDRLRILHQNNIVHRDIKPENILTDTTPQGNWAVHLVDFGLATHCNISQTSPLTGNLPFIGTVPYASIAAHKGIAQARKDDLEALGYVLIKLIKGSLPWENLGGANLEELSEETLRVKQNISLRTLCHGLPAELLVFLRHVRNISFAEIPDYEGLRFLLLNAQDGMDSDHE